MQVWIKADEETKHRSGVSRVIETSGQVEVEYYGGERIERFDDASLWKCDHLDAEEVPV